MRDWPPKMVALLDDVDVLLPIVDRHLIIPFNHTINSRTITFLFGIIEAIGWQMPGLHAGGEDGGVVFNDTI